MHGRRALVVAFLTAFAIAVIAAPSSAPAADARPRVEDQVKRGLWNTFFGWTSVFTEAFKTQNGVDLVLLIPRGAVKAVLATGYGPVEVVTSAIPEKPLFSETGNGSSPEQVVRGASNTLFGWVDPLVDLASSDGGIDTALKLVRAPFRAASRIAYGATEIVTSPVPESPYLGPPAVTATK